MVGEQLVLEDIGRGQRAVGVARGVTRLSEAFPTVRARWLPLPPHGPRLPALDAVSWAREPAEVASFDAWGEELAARGPLHIAILGEAAAVELCAIQVLTRAQRWLARRNAESATVPFSRLLARLAKTRATCGPIARSAHDHALDVWQWVLRLDPHASLETQLAALLLHAERLSCVAVDEATSGSERCRALLLEASFDPGVVERVLRSMSQPVRRDEPRLIDAADALSFLSLDSAVYLARFGPERTARVVCSVLRRLGDAGEALVGTIKLDPLVQGWVERAHAKLRRPA